MASIKGGPVSTSAGHQAIMMARGGGDKETIGQLATVFAQELQRLAARQIAGERHSHLLHTPASVNEAYMKLIDWKSVRWNYARRNSTKRT